MAEITIEDLIRAVEASALADENGVAASKSLYVRFGKPQIASRTEDFETLGGRLLIIDIADDNAVIGFEVH